MDVTIVVLTLAAAVGAGTPLALAALGALLSERAGVLNLGIEGLMLVGAVNAFIVAEVSGQPLLGLVAGAAAGGALAIIHAFLSITMRANQIVAGLALVLLGTGIAMFLGQPIEGQPLSARLPDTSLPLLSEIPILGRILFDQDVVVYGTWVVIAAATFYLMRTRTGLAVRAVGEAPATADVMGIRVAAVRYAHVVASGVFAGAGGAYIILARVPAWAQDGTTAGLGWIAIALVVFASWRPWRALAGAYLFGVALRANFALQAAGFTAVPAEFLSMLPYLVTVAVLMVITATDTRERLGAPTALGVPYVRDER
ncbi:ABC transporter permease [Egibacter rhizosphaerae]|uniref:ABC transporter permease n=1 Tax=Egibacter rhizosphaerae TaxID=1670831 RepID=A0A411YEU5_9ACTN|nr:ABC transporter permease [Egibacter rhizosphaerae]QBI19738.1 ABC transporter permease [Egibacter rhizosphaerae]